MYTTPKPTPLTLAEDYLDARGGDIGLYREAIIDGAKVGQAFFLALSEENALRLARQNEGRSLLNHDNLKGSEAIYAAIEFLLDTEDEVAQLPQAWRNNLKDKVKR